MFSWKNNLVGVKGWRACRSSGAFAFAVFVLLASCKKKEEAKATYYPVDSLISAQILYLSATRASLQKFASVDQKNDTILYVPEDSAAWSNELGVLAQLGTLNKPIYRSLYTIKDGIPDSKSNLTIRHFETKEDLPIPFLKVYYDKTIANVRRIESVYREENALYKSTQTLSIELQDIYNKTVITSYTINGNQKMILADSMEFYVDARILLVSSSH